jgi:hypothetical protein
LLALHPESITDAPAAGAAVRASPLPLPAILSSHPAVVTQQTQRAPLCWRTLVCRHCAPPTPAQVDPNNIYTSDVHPVLRQRSRALKDLPPLEPAGDAGKPVLPAH